MSWNSTCFGQFVCPSSGVYSLYTQQWYMSYRQLSSRARKLSTIPDWHMPLLKLQWINCWWWTEELSETCIVSCQNKFVKLVHLVGFIMKKFVTMHGHVNVKKMINRIYYKMLTLKRPYCFKTTRSEKSRTCPMLSCSPVGRMCVVQCHGSFILPYTITAVA